MKLTEFRFFKNTPLIDFQNTIHFTSNAERDAFFLEGGHYPELPVQELNFNFIRDRSTVILPVSYESMRGVNYCTFLSDFENVRYYAYDHNHHLHLPGTQPAGRLPRLPTPKTHHRETGIRTDHASQ